MCDGYPCDNLAMWLNYNNFNNIQSDFYWSSTTYAATPTIAWIINMQNGNAGGYVKTAQTYVLLVRGGQSGSSDPTYPANIPKTGQETCYGEDGNTITCDATGQDGDLQKGVTWPSPRFSITYCNNSGPCSNQGSDCDANPNNDIVKDNLTGLTWLRDGSLGGQKQWTNALSYANSLTMCGMSGWRLPNVNERVSLINFSQTDMAAWLNTQQFVNVPSAYFWTSSTNAADTANAWYNNMTGGAISGLQNKTTSYYVWPVKTSCVTPPSNMVSWWKAEDNTSDSVGTNGGSLMNGATYDIGKVGKAFSLDGVDDYVKLPDSNLWDFGTNDFTIDAWINTTTPNATMRLTSAGSQADGAYKLWGFGYGSHANWGTGQRLNFVVYDAGSPHPYHDVTSDEIVLTSNTWHHIAVVRSGNNFTFYFNGVAVGTQTYSVNIGGGSTGLLIGARHELNSSNIIEYAKGLIDELEIYNRALTQSEIQAIYDAGSAGKCFTADTTPDAFTFTDQTGVPVDTDIISNTITVTGISSSTTIEIDTCSTNCWYKVNDDDWVSVSGTVLNGDTVRVKQRSSASTSTQTNLTLNIGGVTDTFSVTTASGTQKSLLVNKSGTGTITSIPSGVNCGTGCTNIYSAFTTNSKVNLLFSPTPSSVVVGGNTISNVNAVTIRELNADTTVTVNFP